MLPGSSEWLVILGITVLLFGPKKLPQLGGAIGETLRNFKKGLKSEGNDDAATPEPNKSAEAGSKPLQAAAQPLPTAASAAPATSAPDSAPAERAV